MASGRDSESTEKVFTKNNLIWLMGVIIAFLVVGLFTERSAALKDISDMKIYIAGDAILKKEIVRRLDSMESKIDMAATVFRRSESYGPEPAIRKGDDR